MLRVVICGGPCSGKTTVVKLLEKKGYFVFHEVASQVIKEQKIKNTGLDPKKNTVEFQHEVIRRLLENESKIPENTNIVFYDIGVIESLVYCKFRGFEPTKEILEGVNKIRYDIAFFMDMLPNFEDNGIRVDNQEEAAKVHKILHKAYIENGYKPYVLPDVGPEKRVEMIEETIRRINS